MNIKDFEGVVLMYVKDGEVYPVAMNADDLEMLQIVVQVFAPLKIMKNKPQGTAVDLMEGKRVDGN